MRLPRLAALSIALSATACSTSSPPPNNPLPQLQAAQARAAQAVQDLAPPRTLEVCQDGSQPWTQPGAGGALVYRCPAPLKLKAAIDGGAPMDTVAAAAIEALQVETDLRFQAKAWADAHRPAAATAPTPAPAATPQPWWHVW